VVRYRAALHPEMSCKFRNLYEEKSNRKIQ
jgi:hypothetical protein